MKIIGTVSKRDRRIPDYVKVPSQAIIVNEKDVMRVLIYVLQDSEAKMDLVYEAVKNMKVPKRELWVERCSESEVVEKIIMKTLSWDE